MQVGEGPKDHQTTYGLSNMNVQWISVPLQLGKSRRPEVRQGVMGKNFWVWFMETGGVSFFLISTKIPEQIQIVGKEQVYSGF